MEVGEKLAREGFLVRTGAGPGIMDAVPLGWKREVSRSLSSSLDSEHSQTQGVSTCGMLFSKKFPIKLYPHIDNTIIFSQIRIELPFEQAVSPNIDVNTMMKTFAIRRTALIWNSWALAVFPGGLGTVNELFEAWVGASDHKVACPIVVLPSTFYKPFLDAIESVAVEKRKIISPCDFSLVQSSHSADNAIELLQQPLRSKAEGTQFTLREKLIYLRHELGRGLTAVSKLDPAVVFMGPRYSLSSTDPEVRFIGRLVKEILAKTLLGMRLGVNGVLNEAVTGCAKDFGRNTSESRKIQRIMMTEEMPIGEADAHFESRVAHCETLVSNAKAALFLPGDLPTLNVLFSLVCEIQTRRRSSMPVFLVGTEYWQPIMEVSLHAHCHQAA